MPRPTHVRYAVLAVATAAAALLYLERVCIAMASGYIREDLGLSPAQISLALGMFFWAYALAQVPSGWLTDRFGPRRMMTIYLVAWSVFGVSIAVAPNFELLLAARFALGLSQAGAYPTLSVVVKRWTPIAARGVASSIVSFGGRFGGAGANLLTALLIVWFVPLSTSARLERGDLLDAPALEKQLTAEQQNPRSPWRASLATRLLVLGGEEERLAELNTLIGQPGSFDAILPEGADLPAEARALANKSPAERTPAESQRLNRLLAEQAFPQTIRQLYGAGWRPALLVYGMLGVLAGALFWFVVRDEPTDHPRVNALEASWIAAGQVASPRAPPRAIPWRRLAGSLNLAWFSSLQFFTNIGWAFIITLMPDYLAETFNVPIEQRGLMTTMPLIGGCVGTLLGGWLTDRLVAPLGLRWARSIPLGGLKVLCIAAMLACPWLNSAWAVTIALTLMSAGVDLAGPATWSLAQDVGGREVGSVLGWGNMWGNFGAGLSPLLLRSIQQHSGWHTAFFLCAGAFVFAGMAGLLCDATRLLEPLAETRTDD